MIKNFTLSGLKKELCKRQNSFEYSSEDQAAPASNCCFVLSFSEILVDEFLCTVCFRGSGGSMCLYGVQSADLYVDDDESCASLTINCRKYPGVNRQVQYIFKK